MVILSIVIPCFNESGAIPRLIEACKKAVESREDIEFIFVNNGSADQTQLELEKYIQHSNLRSARVFTIEKNIGYGNGITRGFSIAKGQVFAFTHADMQCDPADVVRAFDLYKNELLDNTGIVKGERKKRNLFDSFFTFGMSVIASAMLGVNVSDVNAQPKLFNRSFFESLTNPPKDFSLDLFILYSALKSGKIIRKYPVVFADRLTGKAKGGGSLQGKIKLIRRTFKYIVQLRRDVKIIK